jgi:hypothetical protein
MVVVKRRAQHTRAKPVWIEVDGRVLYAAPGRRRRSVVHQGWEVVVDGRYGSDQARHAHVGVACRRVPMPVDVAHRAEAQQQRL